MNREPPAHKQTDPNKAADQTITPVDEETPGAWPFPIHTLNDYIQRKEQLMGIKKKLTFDEWYAASYLPHTCGKMELEELMELAWNAAKDNK
jgi:hypothetical protein